MLTLSKKWQVLQLNKLLAINKSDISFRAWWLKWCCTIKWMLGPGAKACKPICATLSPSGVGQIWCQKLEHSLVEVPDRHRLPGARAVRLLFGWKHCLWRQQPQCQHGRDRSSGQSSQHSQLHRGFATGNVIILFYRTFYVKIRVKSSVSKTDWVDKEAVKKSRVRITERK